VNTLLRGLELQPGVLRLARAGGPELVEEPAPIGRPEIPDAQAQVQRAWEHLDDERSRWREQAEQELATLRQKVAQDAREAGRAEGLADARAQHAQKLEQLDAVIERLGRLLGQELQGAQDLAIAVAYESVLKIVGDAVATPEGVRAIVTRAIAAARQQEKLVVRVSSADYRLLLEELPTEHALARPGIDLLPDERMADGGCVIETDAGQLDARLATQLASLRDVLLQARRQCAAGSRS
jgi:flagellar assembly protein FliH